MKSKKTYSILIAICIIGFWAFENFYTPDTYSASEGEGVTKIEEDFFPSSTTGNIVHHNHFSLSYNEAYEQAEWVAYSLKKEQLTYDDRKRPYFIEDPKVKTKSANWRNYKGSGYDRGHLCPAGDRRFSEYAYNETFYTSNVSPQDNNFNGGIWNRLEQKIRYWTKKYNEVYVITGGVLEKGLPTIGDEDVAIPKFFFKIIARKENKKIKVIAFLFPHKESKKAIEKFAVPVDKIEKMTGINFFEKLPVATADQLEKMVVKKGWKF